MKRYCLALDLKDDPGLIMQYDRYHRDVWAEQDRLNPVVQEWEQLMWNFQQPLPQAAVGEKWQLMRKVFEIGQH